MIERREDPNFCEEFNKIGMEGQLKCQRPWRVYMLLQAAFCLLSPPSVMIYIVLDRIFQLAAHSLSRELMWK